MIGDGRSEVAQLGNPDWYGVAAPGGVTQIAPGRNTTYPIIADPANGRGGGGFGGGAGRVSSASLFPLRDPTPTLSRRRSLAGEAGSCQRSGDGCGQCRVQEVLG